MTVEDKLGGGGVGVASRVYWNVEPVTTFHRCYL